MAFSQRAPALMIAADSSIPTVRIVTENPLKICSCVLSTSRRSGGTISRPDRLAATVGRAKAQRARFPEAATQSSAQPRPVGHQQAGRSALRSMSGTALMAPRVTAASGSRASIHRTSVRRRPSGEVCSAAPEAAEPHPPGAGEGALGEHRSNSCRRPSSAARPRPGRPGDFPVASQTSRALAAAQAPGIHDQTGAARPSPARA